MDTTVTVDYATVSNSALSPSDYLPLSGTLTFNPGDQSRTITVPLVDSEFKEFDETFWVNLTNIQANGANVVFAKQQSEVTIVDDDRGLLSINDVSVDENAGFVELTISLDRPDDTLFTVDFITAPGGAESNSDFQHTTGTATFNPGDLSQRITIPIINSDLVEFDETFLVQLLNVQSTGIYPKISDSQGEVTIIDDDQATISIDDRTVNEAEGTAIISLTLDQAVDTMVSVDFATTGGSAEASIDFIAKSDRVTLPPNS